jgi:hypothetical protein
VTYQVLRGFEGQSYQATESSRPGEKELPSRGGAAQFRRGLDAADEANPVL